MKSILLVVCRGSFQAALLLHLTGAVSTGAATLSVSPPAISNTFAGMLTLHVGGLTNGETVLVEKFLDVNSNGVPDAAD